jgi:transcriptional regulator with GAF, ATPase, and Fis domain
LTECDEVADLSAEEANVLRLLGMQVSEFLAADPDVDRLLQAVSAVGVEGVAPLEDEVVDGDAELARSVCEAIAAESEPDRVLRRALTAVSQHFRAVPVSLHLLSADGASLESEAEVDCGVVGDRTLLPADRGLTGLVARTGQLVAVDDPARDARFDEVVDTASDGVMRPYVCVPLKLRDKVVGVLRVFQDPEARTSPRSAEVLAAAFSAAIRNVLLYRSLVQSIEEVAEARRLARS